MGFQALVVAPMLDAIRHFFFFIFFFLDKKETKSQGKNNAPHFFRANAQRLRKLKKVYRYRLGRCRLRCVLCETTGGAVFSLAFLIEVNVLDKAKKRRWKISFTELHL